MSELSEASWKVIAAWCLGGLLLAAAAFLAAYVLGNSAEELARVLAPKP